MGAVMAIVGYMIIGACVSAHAKRTNAYEDPNSAASMMFFWPAHVVVWLLRKRP